MTRYSPIDGEVIRTTALAILVELPDGEERWIPRSVCDCGDDLEEGDTDVQVAEWWALQEGLI